MIDANTYADDQFEAFSIEFDEESSCRPLLPRVQLAIVNPLSRMPPLQTTLVALFLLTGGTLSLLAGVYVFFSDMNYDGSSRGLEIILLGMLSKLHSALLEREFLLDPSYAKLDKLI